MTDNEMWAYYRPLLVELFGEEAVAKFEARHPSTPDGRSG
jgi:hypothetical protein